MVISGLVTSLLENHGTATLKPSARVTRDYSRIEGFDDWKRLYRVLVTFLSIGMRKSLWRVSFDTSELICSIIFINKLNKFIIGKIGTYWLS